MICVASVEMSAPVCMEPREAAMTGAGVYGGDDRWGTGYPAD